jgi:hypothetical protein
LIRLGSVTLPSLIGTLKSALITTRDEALRRFLALRCWMVALEVSILDLSQENIKYFLDWIHISFYIILINEK